MTVFDTALSIAYNDPNFYTQAVYVKKSDPTRPFRVRVVLASGTKSDQFDRAKVSTTVGIFNVRLSDIPKDNPPEKGDVISVGAEQYEATKVSVDDLQIEWTISSKLITKASEMTAIDPDSIVDSLGGTP